MIVLVLLPGYHVCFLVCVIREYPSAVSSDLLLIYSLQYIFNLLDHPLSQTSLIKSSNSIDWHRE